MRSETNKEKLNAFMREIGLRAQGPGRVYLVGGASALLLGIRDQTIDIDIKLDPEPRAIFESIAAIKEQLGVNVELSSPDLFMPALPGWKERSEFIAVYGQFEFYHFDFCAQALAKVLRGHRHDLSDALDFVRLGKVDFKTMASLFAQIKPEMIRFPSIDVEEFTRRLSRFGEEVILLDA